MAIQYQLPNLPLLGKGSILFDMFDANGNLTGYQHMGNCSDIEHEIKDSEEQLYQSMNSVPALIDTAVKQRDITVSITGTDFAFSHLALGQAAAGVTTLATGTIAVVGEALASATATKKGKYFATLGRNIGTVVVHQGGSPLTAGTDYVVVDALGGLIYFPVTSTVSDITAVTVDYTPTAVNISQIAGCTVPYVKGRLRFVPDPVSGKKIGVEWWRCNLSPEGKLALVADKYGNWQLKARVLFAADINANAPYYLISDYGSTSGQVGYTS